jgi:phytoene synthase
VKEENNDRLFCREQVLRTDPAFRMSHLFAEKAFQDRLLALYAFFSVIEQVCSSMSDQSVAERTLAWWRVEMQAGAGTPSSHPVLTELRRSGAADNMPSRLIKNLLDEAGYRIDAPAPAGEAELEQLCLRTGRPLVELELAVCGVDETDPASLGGLVARRGFMQLIRENLAQTGERSSWWLPLDLLARHGLARADLFTAAAAHPAKLLMTDILGIKSFEKPSFLVKNSDISNKKQGDRHLFVYDALARRKLKCMNSNSPVDYPEELAKLGVGDLLACWKTARRFSLSK